MIRIYTHLYKNNSRYFIKYFIAIYIHYLSFHSRPSFFHHRPSSPLLLSEQNGSLYEFPIYFIIYTYRYSDICINIYTHKHSERILRKPSLLVAFIIRNRYHEAAGTSHLYSKHPNALESCRARTSGAAKRSLTSRREIGRGSPSEGKIYLWLVFRPYPFSHSPQLHFPTMYICIRT